MPEINKVVFGGNTLIDLTDTTATATDVAQGKVFYTQAGVRTVGTAAPGSGSAIAVVDSQDSHGGTIRTITAVDLSQDTVSASTLLSGYTAHDANGNAITGTASGGGAPSLQDKSVSYTPSESAQNDTISADTGYDGLGEVTVSVSAVSSTYVGSGITRRSSSDLTASGATVTAPAGYYESAATKSVASGSVTAPSTISGSSATVSTGTNTLTLTKTVSVTPNVTTAGYISSGTAGNSSVSLTASVNTRSSSDLTASGATVTAPAGYYANAATKSVASGTAGTPTASKGTVSNHSISVTPSVSNTTGYITGSTKTGTAVTVTASELVSGSQTIASNGTTDVTNLASVTVAIPIVTYYTGSSAPSSSLGSNGDIYLQS